MERDNHPERPGTRPGTKPLARRSFLVRLMGLGLLPLVWRRGEPPEKPKGRLSSRKADFWRKGNKLAG